MEVTHLFPREQVGHGPAHLVREHGQRCGFAVCVFKLGAILFPWLTLAAEEAGGFGNRPAERDGANLFA